MSSSQTNVDGATEQAGVTAVPMRFEVTTVPVADVDRAKEFYQRLGWRLDIDFKPSPDTRGVQFTPPGSPASVQFGEGTTTMTPGSLQGMILVVDDIVSARDELVRRGVDVSEIWHTEPGQGRVRAWTRSGARTSAARPSRTRTATAGSYRRSPSAYLAGCHR